MPTIEDVAFAICPLEIVDRFFVSPSARSTSEKVKGPTYRARPTARVAKEGQCIIALASFCVSLCQQRHDHRIVRYFSRFLVFGHRFGQLSFHLEALAQSPAGVIKSRIHRERFAQLLDRLVVSPRQHEVLAEVGIDNQGERIEFHGADSFRNRAIEFANHGEIHVAELMMRSCIVRIQFNCPFELFFRLSEIKVVKGQHQPK